MEFTKFDARTAAETAQELHLRDPATGELIMDGDQPCIVLVIGSHSRSVQADILQKARAKINSSKSKKKKEEISALAEVQNTLVEGAMRVIRGFRNIERNGEPLNHENKEDVEWFLDLNFVSVKSLLVQDTDEEEDDIWRGDSFAQQILKASNDAGAYLGKK